MTAAELDAIEARAEAATPGPWHSPLRDTGEASDFPVDGAIFSHAYSVYPPLGESGPVCVVGNLESTPFIAAARQDVPALVAEVRQLQALHGQHATGCPGCGAVGNPEVDHAGDWTAAYVCETEGCRVAAYVMGPLP